MDAASSQTVSTAGTEDKNYATHLEYFICIDVEDWRWMLPHPRLSVELVLKSKNYVAHLEYFIGINVEDWRWMLPHPRLSVELVLKIKLRGSP